MSDRPDRIYHLACRADWATAHPDVGYRHPSLEDEGFVHLSTGDQVIASADLYLAGREDLLLLTVATERLVAPLRWEHSASRGVDFPHLFGPLNLDAVVLAQPLPPGEDGRFAFPPSHPSSPRLRFRSWMVEDLSLAVGLWGDPEVTRWIDARPRLDEDAVRALVEREVGFERRAGVQYWPIFDAVEGRHLGCAGLRPRVEAHGVMGAGGAAVPELGFHLRPDAWGQGYGREAAGAVVDFAFGVLGLAELYAGHSPENVGSRKILEGLGFVQTGEDLYPATGTMHPAYRLVRG